MTDSINRYDRDHNIDGPVLPFTFVPEYGSTVSFENKNVHFNAADNYYKKFSKGVNGTNIKLNLKFSNKTEDEARSFLHFIETVLDTDKNYLDFNSLTPSGVEIAFPTGSIYKNIDELFIENYDFKFHNGLFDIDLNLSKNGYSSLFDWSGSSYLNAANFYTGWDTGINYKEFDVIFYSGYAEQISSDFQTGNYYRIADRRENFYYCLSGHTSEYTNSPTGSNSHWSKSFFYEIDDDISIGSDRSNNIFDLKDSFSSFIKQDQNGGLIKDLSLSLKNRSDKEARSIIHFIEKHEDYRPLELTLPQLYNKKKFFVVKSFEHKFVYKDCNDLDIVLDEIFLFKKPGLFDSYRGNSDGNEFIMNISTTAPNQQIVISGENEDGNDVKIGWGDGQIVTITGYNDPDLTHLYTGVGDYQIRISGYMPNIALPVANDKTKVTSIDQLGIMGWTDMSNSFFGFSNMTSFKAGNTDTSLVANMEGMFRDCYALTGIDLSSINSSSVTGMQDMFTNCERLTGLDLSSFNTASVEDMTRMFKNCGDLSGLDLSNFDTSSVVGMHGMFDSCYQMNILNVSGFDTSLVADMSFMFSDCRDVSGLDLFSFSAESALNMSSMFENCFLLTGLSDLNFSPSVVTGTSKMFENCGDLTVLDLSNFDTSSVTDMSEMFHGCQNLSNLNLSNFNTASVEDMTQMFRNCQNIFVLDLSSFNTSLVADMSEMFYGCYDLSVLNLSSFNTASVEDTTQMFRNCQSLLALDLSSFNTASVVSMSQMFYGCYNLSELNLSSFNTPSVTTFYETFRDCSQLTGLDLSSFDTSSATTMQRMFYNCQNILDLDLSSFNTSLVNDMSEMFRRCFDLTGLNLSSFNTVSVEDMTRMFDSCKDLSGLDLSNFNTASVEDMTQMFYICQHLTGLDLSSFNTASVVSMNQMFYDCEDLTGLNLSSFNTSSVTSFYQTFRDCSQLTGLDLSSFDTSSATTMQRMFYRDSSLVDIIGVDKFNVESCVSSNSLSQFAFNVTLPTFRYDSLLTGWNSQSVANGIDAHFGNSQYTLGSAADAARTNLTGVYFWNITDGGPV